jgi:hypothetical protein
MRIELHAARRTARINPATADSESLPVFAARLPAGATPRGVGDAGAPPYNVVEYHESRIPLPRRFPPPWSADKQPNLLRASWRPGGDIINDIRRRGAWDGVGQR